MNKQLTTKRGLAYYELINTIENYLYDIAAEDNNVDERGDYHICVTLGGENVEIRFQKGFIVPKWVVKPSWADSITVSTEDEFRIAAMLR